MDKKKRSYNFTKEEELLLMKEVEKYKNILECKSTDKVNNVEKNRAWNSLTLGFNAVNQVARTAEQLKSKFDNLKTRARRIASQEKIYIKGTGGGPSYSTVPVRDPAIEAVLRVVNEKTVVGLSNPNDSDGISSLSENIPSVTSDANELILVVEEDDDEEDHSYSSENFIFQKPIKVKREVLERQQELPDQSSKNAQKFKNDWSTYTPKKLKTPVSKKLQEYKSTQTDSKGNYYKIKTALLEEELKLKKMDVEDRTRKREREEEEYQIIRLKILKCDLVLKKKEISEKE